MAAKRLGRRSMPVAALVSALVLWRFAAMRWCALAALLAVYAIASLYPFAWQVPEHHVNGAVRQAEGWSFPTAGIVMAEPPLDGLVSAIRAETLDVSLEVRPQRSHQTGPARLLTISDDAYERDLTLAQDGSDLVVRLRSEDSDINGLHDGEPIARIENVLEAGTWVAIDARIEPGGLTVAIDGVPRLTAALPAATLATWDRDFGLVLGNEMTCNRPWLGDIRKAVVADPEGTTDYAAIEEVEVPAACWDLEHIPKLVPLVSLNKEDALINILMYLPLGCLLGLMVRRRSAGAFAALAVAIAGLSLSFEALQFLQPSRFPSVDDVIFNALGGMLGVWLGFWLSARLQVWLSERQPDA